QALRTKLQPFNSVGHVPLGMSQPAARIGGEVSVVAGEQRIAALYLVDLHQVTLVAGEEFEREPNLRGAEPVRAQEGIGRWRTAEVEEYVVQRRLAESALHACIPAKESSIKA